MIAYDEKIFEFPKEWYLAKRNATYFILGNNLMALTLLFWLLFAIIKALYVEISIFLHILVIILAVLFFCTFPYILYSYNVTLPLWNHTVIRDIHAPELVVVRRVKIILDENNIPFIYISGNECQKKFGHRFTKVKHVFEFPHEGIKIIYYFLDGFRGNKTRVHIKPYQNKKKAFIERIVKLIEIEVPSLEAIEPMEKATGE